MANEKTFYLQGGKTMTNLKTLAKELREMPDDVYGHHVNDLKNDFASWVKYSLAKEELADRIDGHVHRIEMELHVLRHLIHDEKVGKKPAKKKAASSKKKAPAKKAKPAVKKAAPKKKKVAKKPTPKKKAPAKKKVAPKKKAPTKKAAPKKKTVAKKTVKKAASSKKKTAPKKKSKK